MNRLTCLLAISLSCLHPLLHGQSSPFYGDWREPAGSVIRIEHCNSGVCMRIVLLSPKVPSTIDTKNPDAAQRRRALCDLVIGSGFQLIDPTHASGGSLYDPKSGNTYRGTMSVEGDVVKLRGYVGIPLFGRTETWQRVPAISGSCR